MFFCMPGVLKTSDGDGRMWKDGRRRKNRWEKPSEEEKPVNPMKKDGHKKCQPKSAPVNSNVSTWASWATDSMTHLRFG